MWKSGKKKSSSHSGIDDDAALALYHEIADEDDPNVITMEGIAVIGEKLGIDVTEDIRILVLLWKMGCTEKPSVITKTEFLHGCYQLQADSWDKFRDLLPSLDTGFLEMEEFKDFYKFCFQFNLQGTHKTLDKDLVIALLPMVLGDRIDRTESFCEFLSQSSYTRITLDQWASFLDFCYNVDDLSQYDESTSAWPVLLDEYVDFMNSKK